MIWLPANLFPGEDSLPGLSPHMGRRGRGRVSHSIFLSKLKIKYNPNQDFSKCFCKVEVRF